MVPDLKLPGVLMSAKKSKEGRFRLKKLGGRKNIIIFYTVGCPVCDAEKAVARALVQKDAQEESDWLSAEYAEGVVTYTASANEDEKERTAFLLISSLSPLI